MTKRCNILLVTGLIVSLSVTQAQEPTVRLYHEEHEYDYYYEQIYRNSSATYEATM